MSSVFQIVVFDLDDTLLDSSRDLIPQAFLEAWEAMRKKGLCTDHHTLWQRRLHLLSKDPRHFSFDELLEGESLREPIQKSEVAKAGRDAFYERKIPITLQAEASVHDLLHRLKGKYTLYLVTAGDPETQKSKVEQTKLTEYFKNVIYVNPFKGESKFAAYKQIQLENSKLAPENFLAVGNRVDTDLAPAKELQWKTCWIAYGEYRHLQPTHDLEKPDYRVSRIQDIEKVCPL